MTTWKKLFVAAALAVGGTAGTAAAHEPEAPVAALQKPCADDDLAAREAHERDRLAGFVARLGAEERADLERYIWSSRLDPVEAQRARAHLARQQEIRDAEDFRHLADQQALRRVENREHEARRAFAEARPYRRW